MLTHLFYLTTLWFLFLEWSWLVMPKEKTENAKKFFDLSNQHKGKKWDDYSDEYKSEIKSKIWLFIPIIWTFIGLFTFQWIAFLMHLVFNLVVIAPLSRLTRYSLSYTVLHWTNSLLGFAFGIFIIINHYHLKINLSEWLWAVLK